MKPLRLFQPGGNPWLNGLRLALLNIALAAFSAGSFMGVLLFVSWFNRLGSTGDGPSLEVPFPYPVLLLLYAILFPVVWIWFGRRSPNGRRERTITGLVGAGPLFGLALLGYAGVAGAFVVNEFNPDAMPVGSFFVFGGLATLIFLAGMACVGAIAWIRGCV